MISSARARLEATRIASPIIGYSNLEATRGTDLSDELDGNFRVPLLFLSSNFGMEAAQVEALLELIEFLATDDSDETIQALSKLVVLIVPMINPDARVTALEHWASRPLSPAWPAQGNVFGIEVTREYLHLVEPETWALARLVERWRPFMLWEVHEDGIGLGWGQPQVCLCPPISPHGSIGIDSPIAPGVTESAALRRAAEIWQGDCQRLEATRLRPVVRSRWRARLAKISRDRLRRPGACP